MASLNVPNLSVDQLATAKMVDMVAMYNRLTGKAILKFQDRATAIRRCTEALNRKAPPAEPPRKLEVTKPVTEADKSPYQKSMERRGEEPERRPRSAKRDLKAVSAEISRRTTAPTETFTAMSQMASTLTTPPRPAAPLEKHTQRKRGPKPKFDLNSKIVLVQTTNPKRKDTRAHEEYEFYRTATTVAMYVDFGGQLAYLNYDVKRGFIKIVPPGAAKK